jgi:hypothetical protein
MSKWASILDAKLTYLYSRQGGSAVKLGLDTTWALLRAMQVDPVQLPCVHVAGTNGKGSVSAMIESVLREAGLRTALYTSPHLIRFNERIRVAGCRFRMRTPPAARRGGARRPAAGRAARRPARDVLRADHGRGLEMVPGAAGAGGGAGNRHGRAPRQHQCRHSARVRHHRHRHGAYRVFWATPWRKSPRKKPASSSPGARW